MESKHQVAFVPAVGEKANARWVALCALCAAHVVEMVCATAAETLYVAPNGRHVSPFATWADAATNIQAAVDAARTGERVLVSNGVYRLADAVQITNAIVVESLEGPAATTVDGGNATSVFWIWHTNAVVSGFTVVNGYAGDYMLSTAGGIRTEGLVSNCVVRSCAAEWGGGAYVVWGGRVVDCTFEGNVAMRGGAVYVYNGRVENCRLEDNAAEESGGGATGVAARDLLLRWDFDGDGAVDREGPDLTNEVFVFTSEGIYSPAFSASNALGEELRLVLTNGIRAYATNIHYVRLAGSDTPPYTNWATAAHSPQAALEAADNGDTVLVTNGVFHLPETLLVWKAVTLRSVHGATATILDGAGVRRCLALANDGAVVEGFTLAHGAADDGAGAYLEGGMLRRCMVRDCEATGSGGGLFLTGTAVAQDCLVVRNASLGGSGGAYLQHWAILTNVTLSLNRSGNYHGGVYMRSEAAAYNCISWGNVSRLGPDDAGDFFASCFPGAIEGIDRNTRRDPLFLGAALGDFHLAANSPCVDAGIASAAAAERLDLAGESRVSGAAVDMGCYEQGRLRCGFDVEPAYGIAPFEVAFTPRFAGTNTAALSGSWDFDGDGVWDAAYTDGAIERFTYALPGRYDVELAVGNAAGETYRGRVDQAIAVYRIPTHYVSSAGAHAWPYDSWSAGATNLAAAVAAARDGHTIHVTLSR
ncbi:MAG: hypothetical protein FJ387_23260 [Verrucomicrobia bacterium]|nr:hypothetical protein [Verrucomicrobiota bacterium]